MQEKRTLSALLLLQAVALLCLLSPVIADNASTTHYNGIIFVGANYSTQSSFEALQNLSATGANMVSIVITRYQNTINSTRIFSPYPPDLELSNLVSVIKQARSLGLQTCLKPHVDLNDDPDHWRGQIGTFFSESDWEVWFFFYRVYLQLMASVAQNYSVELLNVGTELSGTEKQSLQWRRTINNIRKIYQGPITYGTNWFFPGQNMVDWWDAVDFIGIDGYFPLATHVSPPLSEIQNGWIRFVTDLQNLSFTFNRSVIFTEIGYESMNDAAITPWDANGPLDLQTQANCYMAFFNVVYPLEWVSGVFWWAWDNDPNAGGPQSRGFDPAGKPAEDVLKLAYGHSTLKRS